MRTIAPKEVAALHPAKASQPAMASPEGRPDPGRSRQLGELMNDREGGGERECESYSGL